MIVTASENRKAQRVRDPVHGLIVFKEADDLEQLAWRLLNAAEFQRLRRVRQLGFSEFVYPGATHTRFSHSIGVFHTARELVSILRGLIGPRFSEERANVSVCAALLHDLGHGPFSHTFEGVMKSFGTQKKHEKWTVEIIRSPETQVGRILQEYDQKFCTSVADLLEQEYPSDIYSSIVSSQFDADRLDYLRRDRLMTGTELGGFDWSWLYNNFEVEKIMIGGDGDVALNEVEGIILGTKGLQAAEGYLLGRFHLYNQVYMHKTTRGAEKLFGSLLGRIAALVAQGNPSAIGLPPSHPLLAHISDQDAKLSKYLALDDALIWGALSLLEIASDEQISEQAGRLRRRELYKCFDVGAKAEALGSDVSGKFRKRLEDAKKNNAFGPYDVLEDRAKVSPYSYHEYESRDALAKITIRRPDGRHEDVAKVSDVIKSLQGRNLFRVYGRNTETMVKLKGIWEEAAK